MTASVKDIELHAEFFNLFNHVNFSNPINKLNVIRRQSRRKWTNH